MEKVNEHCYFLSFLKTSQINQLQLALNECNILLTHTQTELANFSTTHKNIVTNSSNTNILNGEWF